jgi:hypothetical protein
LQPCHLVHNFPNHGGRLSAVSDRPTTARYVSSICR